MEDSGLDDVWAEVYARNSLRKMLEGKSYAKTLRACLLTDAALHILLLNKDSVVQDNIAQTSDDIDDENEIDSSGKLDEDDADDEEIPEFLYEENLPFIASEEIVSNYCTESDLLSESEIPCFVSEEVIWNDAECLIPDLCQTGK